ncbi:MAG: Crp/Fnr family transcriptional regulator [Bacteroidetes bacterium]|nr:Crp/Fnr family transcriptional regulator [Bacteroidota bacterium]
MESISNILRTFPFLGDSELEKEVLTHTTVMNAVEGDVLVREGQYLKVLPLVITGSLRVVQHSEERSILLYHVLPGETCIMSLSSCFFNAKSPTEAVAEAESEILCVPAGLIREWQRRFDPWNEFVIGTFQGRYNELLSLFSSVAFNNIEIRIANYLTNRCDRQQSNRVPITHLELANVLGTTRVVVSRILKRFEQEGKVKLLRSSIEVIDL